MKYTPFLVVIPYLASAAQGRELEYAIAGWRRHFKEDFLIVLTGENLPHIEGDDIVLVESKRVPNVDGQYRQHLDYVSCFKKVRQRFPDSQGFIFVADDCYAINDFDLVDVLVPKFLERNLGGFHIDSPNGWRVDKAKTRCALVDGGYPQMNYTTHLPIWFDWDKIEDKRKASFKKKLDSIAQKMRAIDYSRPGHTGVVVKAKFYAVRMLQTSLGKQNPEYTDFKYWNENGWIGKVRPWK